jgi:hypothetical protein
MQNVKSLVWELILLWSDMVVLLIYTGHLFTMSNGTYWGNATELAACVLRTDGGTEDGYVAIDYALNNLMFREGAAKHFILITDEDRDNVLPHLDKIYMTDRLVTENITLHTIVNANYKDENNNNVLGGTLDGIAYLAESGGEYVDSDGLTVVNGSGITINDYVNFSFSDDIAGTSWNLNQLRQGGDIARSFSGVPVGEYKIVVTKTEQVKDETVQQIFDTETNTLSQKVDIYYLMVKCRRNWRAGVR